MSSGLPLDQLGSTIKLHIQKAEHAEGKQLEHYKSAGLHLIEAKRRVEAGEYSGKHFTHFCAVYGRISTSRAYELMAISDGRTTVEDIRAGNNARQAEKRVRDVTEKHQPVDSIGKNVKQVVKSAMGRPPVDELSHLRSLINKQLKSLNKDQLLEAQQFIKQLSN